MSDRLSWVGSIGCEGGPVLVADVDGYAKWLGATPIAKLRAIPNLPDSMKERLPARRTLHYWGQFSDELPSPFTQAGGHRYLECASEEEARAKLAELRDAVCASGDVKVSEAPHGDELHFVRKDQRQLWAELAPKSAYDEAWQSPDADEAWVHRVGPDAKGLFWAMEGSGVADVGVTADRDEIVLVRAWLGEAEDEQVAAARALVDAPREDEAESDATIDLPSGMGVFVWSPLAPFDLAGVAGPAALRSAIADSDVLPLSTKSLDDVGLAMRVAAGRYGVRLGRHEDDGWSCHWCRLRLVPTSS